MTKKQKKIKFTSLIVVFSVAYIIGFTIACFFVMLNGQTISDTLITCTFSFFGIELLSCAGIKVTKNKYVQSYEDNLEGNSNE